MTQKMMLGIAFAAGLVWVLLRLEVERIEAELAKKEAKVR
jgi:hypothetical protein